MKLYQVLSGLYDLHGLDLFSLILISFTTHDG